MLEVDEEASEIVTVFLESMISRLDITAVEKPENSLLEGSRAFPGNDFDFVDSFCHGFVDNRLQRTFD